MTADASPAAHLTRIAAADPEVAFDTWLQTRAGAGEEALLAVDFEFCEYWRDGRPTVALTALFYTSGDPLASAVAVLPRARFDTCEKKWRERPVGLIDLLGSLPVTAMPFAAAMPLQPVAIPKPWGREIWYTGIERRGVAKIGAAGRSVPLPWLLAVAPRRLTGGVLQPILLKILDPLPEPVFGDLYFELHRRKQEVYIVTAVDRRAWPDGVGAIRFGFDADRRREYPDDAAFIDAYLAAVRAYRTVRRRIDTQLDALRARAGIDPDAPVPAATLQQWLREVDTEMQTEEAVLRARMEAFTALLPLRVGDVVRVPCLLPHSLQHGVRTVEFQTPVYERLILSFAQKVLTQAEWDTEAAAGVLQLDPEPAAALPLIAQGEGWRAERIVAFDDFEVRRITLQPGAQLRLQLEGGYGLGMVVGQALVLGGSRFEADAAVLLPAGLSAASLRNDTAAVAYFLLALPLH